MITATALGSSIFKKKYDTKLAYMTGSMYRGISSAELVIRLGKANMLGFLGSAGLSLPDIEKNIARIEEELTNNQTYGVNLIHMPDMPDTEMAVVDLFIEKKMSRIEASAFMNIVPSIVYYRLKGAHVNSQGKIVVPNRVIGKISRPEVCQAFLSPAPEKIVSQLVAENKITEEEAKLAAHIPVASDITVESDSGGHTDQGIALALFPSIKRQVANSAKQFQDYDDTICLGAAGGIGTPEAAAAYLMMGADYLVTGSINQCTVEAGTSDAVKDILQGLRVQDTTYAPAGDMFEIGARVQVAKRGLFFAARANKLYDLYTHHSSLDEIDAKTQQQIQEKYFKRDFNEIYEDSVEYFRENMPQIATKIENDPKAKMAAVFRWYFFYTNQLSFNGVTENRVDFQIHCGPAMGAFNQWVEGSEIEDWHQRHVDEIGLKLMSATAEYMNEMNSKY